MMSARRVIAMVLCEYSNPGMFMRSSLRVITPAALAVVYGSACSKQPAPSPAPTPNQTTTSAASSAQRPARTDSAAEGLLVARQAGQGQGLAEPSPKPYGR